MNLGDFSISTQALRPKLHLYGQVDKILVPINEIQLVNAQIMFQTKNNYPVITLDQFRTRSRQIANETNMFIGDLNHPLFGYRIDQDKLILG